MLAFPTTYLLLGLVKFLVATHSVKEQSFVECVPAL